MIACICRNIRETDYNTKEELKARIMECDYNCGICQQAYLKNEVPLDEEIFT
jgi:hypothetical protein